jgi:hypothetical protein
MANSESANDTVGYPFRFDGRGQAASTTQDDHRDLIEQVLFTSPGDRSAARRSAAAC